ncbi:hypothetical protein [Streptosporangium canum]|uniref:hypothetical protein n=1 Tax=Streptosporangium canum TaxID=324952 RepID=UPI001C4345B5|nr:hypothetical protein [Streptosporangium canum]
MEATFRWALVTAIAPVAWGTNYFVTHRFLPSGYPLYGAAIRALPAGLLLLLVSGKRPRGSWWWKCLVGHRHREHAWPGGHSQGTPSWARNSN